MSDSCVIGGQAFHASASWNFILCSSTNTTNNNHLLTRTSVAIIKVTVVGDEELRHVSTKERFMMLLFLLRQQEIWRTFTFCCCYFTVAVKSPGYRFLRIVDDGDGRTVDGFINSSATMHYNRIGALLASPSSVEDEIKIQ